MVEAHAANASLCQRLSPVYKAGLHCTFPMVTPMYKNTSSMLQSRVQSIAHSEPLVLQAPVESPQLTQAKQAQAAANGSQVQQSTPGAHFTMTSTLSWAWG
jgi:hypothetical protein